MLTLPGEPLTRRQFFGWMKRLGFKKSRLQMTRIGLTYDRLDEAGERVTVTVPKYHESTFTILGNVPYSGIFVEAIPGRPVNWGTPVDTDSLGMNMLEVCIGLCSGAIQMTQEPLDGRQEGGAV